MDLRRALAVATLLVATAALSAPVPAAAGPGLSKAKAKQTAKSYAAEICLAEKPQCRGFQIKKCVRNGPKKVTCRTVLERKKQNCSYKLVVRKRDGKVTGRIKDNDCF